MLPRNRLFLFGALFLLAFMTPESRAEETKSNGFINFYQKYISPIDGDRCPMHPSCSRYAADAIKKHGFFTGWIMTSDRLVRCGRDTCKNAPVITIDNENYYYDPVEANDFWWFKKTDSGTEK